MMKNTKLLLAILGIGAVFTACADKQNESPVGSWQSAAPESVTGKIADAASASKTLAFTFEAPKGDSDGVVTLTANYDLVSTDSVASPYTVTASIKGTWKAESVNDDDYILAFDRNSLTVTGTDAPILGPVTDDFISSLAPFTKIEDVKVSKDGKQLKFETDKPEVDYIFVAK